MSALPKILTQAFMRSLGVGKLAPEVYNSFYPVTVFFLKHHQPILWNCQRAHHYRRTFSLRFRSLPLSSISYPNCCTVALWTNQNRNGNKFFPCTEWLAYASRMVLPGYRSSMTTPPGSPKSKSFHLIEPVIEFIFITLQLAFQINWKVFISSF